MKKKNRDIYRVQRGDSYSLFMKNGLKHNLSGPALTIKEHEWYYVKGEKFTYNQWTGYVALHTAYEKSPDVEKACFEKAADSFNGIFVDMEL